MTRPSLDSKSSGQDVFAEKNGVDERVVDSPPSEVDQGIIKDWDDEESAVRRKYVCNAHAQQ